MDYQNTEKAFKQIANLENMLTSALRPVRPDPEYVNRLRRSLGNTTYAVLERKAATDPVLMVLMGIAAGLMALFIFRKFRP